MRRNKYQILVAREYCCRMSLSSCCCLAFISVLFLCCASVAQRSSNSFGSFSSSTSSAAAFGANVQKITLGAILPKTSLITLQRQYYKVIHLRFLIKYTFNLLIKLTLSEYQIFLFISLYFISYLYSYSKSAFKIQLTVKPSLILPNITLFFKRKLFCFL